MKKSKLLILVLATLYTSTPLPRLYGQPPNVLFIAVDDLRPELACYGHPQIKSPNIDKLAASGMRFNRSYCNVPVCGASRASILSGIRPNRNRFVNFNCYLDQDVPGAMSLPMHFRNHGYETVSLSKIFHHHRNDSKASWDVIWAPKPQAGGTNLDYQLPENLRIEKAGPSRGYPYEKAEVSDDTYLDGKTARKAVEELNRLKDAGNPFFLAVGFLKPHLPFNAPKKYWDLYDEKDIQPAANPFQPRDAPDAAMHNFGELRNYYSIPKAGPVADSSALQLIHGYYACVSYTDAQIGRVLDELDRLGLAENTIVVLWGDHGWNLGEHGLWCKHCNFEKALRTPLIIRAPGFPQGMVSEQLVEYVDIYPTLCELTGLPKPFYLQGNSLTPLLNGGNPDWKDAVFCRWIKGETVITQTHAYTAWFDDETRQPYARMLYDHRTDPEENVNLSEQPEQKELVESLHEKLMQHLATRDQLRIPPINTDKKP